MGLKKKVEPIADVSDDFEEKREHPRTKEQLISVQCSVSDTQLIHILSRRALNES